MLTGTASNEFYVTNKWNEEHGRPFKIIFESACALGCEDIASGKAGATVSTAQDFERWNREYGARLRIVQPATYNTDTYYMLNKRTVAELQKTFDAALKEKKRFFCSGLAAISPPNAAYQRVGIKRWGSVLPHRS